MTTDTILLLSCSVIWLFVSLGMMIKNRGNKEAFTEWFVSMLCCPIGVLFVVGLLFILCLFLICEYIPNKLFQLFNRTKR